MNPPLLTFTFGSVWQNIVGTALSFSSLLLHSLLKQSGVKCSEQMLLYFVGLKFFLLTAASHFLQRSGLVRGNLQIIKHNFSTFFSIITNFKGKCPLVWWVGDGVQRVSLLLGGKALLYTHAHSILPQGLRTHPAHPVVRNTVEKNDYF